MANKKGRGGFADHPENINRQGLQKRSQDWKKSVNKITDMTREEAIKYVGSKTKIGKLLHELPETISIKEALLFISIIHYGREPNPRMLDVLMTREDGKPTESINQESDINTKIILPAEMIAPDFLISHRAILSGRYTEFVENGGRGSTKSSFVSLEFISLLINNPTMHGLAVRQVGNTLRDSVYSQLTWAINELGLSDKFRMITSPLEMEYLPTKQKIFFRGADDPMKIKSIKPPFGYIGLLWFEELDTFYGSNAVRNIEQSAIRGGDAAYIFKSFNPPRTSNNWANKYLQTPKESQWQHSSDYRSVPVEWLGRVFIDEAEHLQNVNPAAYAHEYIGEVNGLGDSVFENVEVRAITDTEIAQFDNVMHGLDFGFFPHPAHYAKVHYDAARLTLYIYGEVRRWKTSSKELYKLIKKSGYNNSAMLICDSAAPGDIGDFIEYGANARGAMKGDGSVRYSMKWLQSLLKIVIDPVRAPYAKDEFLDYAYLRTKDDEIIEEYPREKDDAIAAVRYATNLIWKQRGK